jgi:hypothetical protein
MWMVYESFLESAFYFMRAACRGRRRTNQRKRKEAGSMAPGIRYDWVGRGRNKLLFDFVLLGFFDLFLVTVIAFAHMRTSLNRK